MWSRGGGGRRRDEEGRGLPQLSSLLQPDISLGVCVGLETDSVIRLLQASNLFQLHMKIHKNHKVNEYGQK